MTSELKPCPFCGAPAHKWSWNGGTRIDCSAWDSSEKRTHYVGIGAKTEAEAIEAWNRRIQPERKIGHWIDGKCSECGEHAPYYSMATAYYLSKFCPNCGERMSHDDP